MSWKSFFLKKDSRCLVLLGISLNQRHPNQANRRFSEFLLWCHLSSFSRFELRDLLKKATYLFSSFFKVVESWQKRRRWGKTIISNELFNSHAAVKNCSSVRQESSILWFMIWSLSWKSKAHQAYEHNKTTIEVNRLSMNFQSHQLFDS